MIHNGAPYGPVVYVDDVQGCKWLVCARTGFDVLIADGEPIKVHAFNQPGPATSSRIFYFFFTRCPSPRYKHDDHTSYVLCTGGVSLAQNACVNSCI